MDYIRLFRRVRLAQNPLYVLVTFFIIFIDTDLEKHFTAQLGGFS